MLLSLEISALPLLIASSWLLLVILERLALSLAGLRLCDVDLRRRHCIES